MYFHVPTPSREDIKVSRTSWDGVRVNNDGLAEEKKEKELCGFSLAADKMFSRDLSDCYCFS